MKKYFFDKDARIEFNCEAGYEQDAIDFFSDVINRAEYITGLRITVDNHIPDKIEENENETEIRNIYTETANRG